MKYHPGECEICVNSRPKPLGHVTFLCFADTGRKYGDSNIVTKNVVAVRTCRYFVKESRAHKLRELLKVIGKEILKILRDPESLRTVIMLIIGVPIALYCLYLIAAALLDVVI